MQHGNDASCDNKQREMGLHKEKKLIASKEVCKETLYQ